jgi:hypothetical protein
MLSATAVLDAYVPCLMATITHPFSSIQAEPNVTDSRTVVCADFDTAVKPRYDTPTGHALRTLRVWCC